MSRNSGRWDAYPGEATQEKPAAKESFGVHPVAWVVFVLAAVLVVWTNIQNNSSHKVDTLVPYITGSLIGLLIVTLLPAWLGFLIGRRSRNVATVVFIAFLALGCYAYINASISRAKARQAVNDMESEIEQARQELRQNQDNNNGIDNGQRGMQTLDKMTAATDKAANSMNGEDARCMRVAGDIMQKLKGAMLPYDAALKDVIKESAMNPSWVKSKEDLGKARAHIKALQVQVKNLRDTFNNMGNYAAEQLKINNIGPANTRAFLDNFNPDFFKARTDFNTIRDQDEQMVQIMSQAADLLESNWGKWHMNSAHKIIFDSTTTTDQYNALYDQLQNLATEQAALQQQYRLKMRQK